MWCGVIACVAEQRETGGCVPPRLLTDPHSALGVLPDPDIFMVFFFGLAAKEVTEALLPGGSLNPPSKVCVWGGAGEG